MAVDYRKTPPRTDPHYYRVELMADLFDAALPADHPLAKCESIDLTELATEIFVTPTPGTSCSEVTSGDAQQAGFSPDVRHYSIDWKAIAGVVALGRGLGWCRHCTPLEEPGVVMRRCWSTRPRAISLPQSVLVRRKIQCWAPRLRCWAKVAAAVGATATSPSSTA